MKDKLIVVESDHGYKYRIQWYLVEEDDIGATLGEEPISKSPSKSEDWENWKANTIAASRHPEKVLEGFYWNSRSDATAILREINLAFKVKEDKPFPEWAQQALKAGWKPPKGWKG